MGVRLYIKARPEIIERIIGVPAGTTQRLEEFWKVHGDDYNDMEKGYEIWQLLQKDKHLATLDTFQTFGWGKLRPDTVKTIRSFRPKTESEDWDWNGSTSDPDAIHNIIEDQLASIGWAPLHCDLEAEIEKVYWG